MIFDEVWTKAKQGLKYLLYAFLAACVVFTVYTAIQKYREVNAAPEKDNRRNAVFRYDEF